MGARISPSEPTAGLLHRLGHGLRGYAGALPPALNPLSYLPSFIWRPEDLGDAKLNVRCERAASDPIKLSWISGWLYRLEPRGEPLNLWILGPQRPKGEEEELSHKIFVRNMVEEVVQKAIEEVAQFDYSTADTVLALEEERAQSVYITFENERYNWSSFRSMRFPAHVRAECVRLFSQVFFNPLLVYPSFLMTKFKNPTENEQLSIEVRCSVDVSQNENVWEIAARVNLSIRGTWYPANEKDVDQNSHYAYLKINFMCRSISKGPISDDSDAPGWNLQLIERSAQPTIGISFQFTKPLDEAPSQFPSPRQMTLIQC